VSVTLPSKKQRIIFNLILSLYIILSLGIIIALTLYSITLYQNNKIYLMILFVVIDILISPILLYTIRESLWLLNYLIRKPPFFYFRMEHIGKHERILINHLISIGEKPDNRLIELTKMKEE